MVGGTSLFIESVLKSAIREDSKPSFSSTGQLGDVMKESTTISYTYAKSFMAKKFPDNRFFDKAGIHMHVPEGATKKDGISVINYRSLCWMHHHHFSPVTRSGPTSYP